MKKRTSLVCFLIFTLCVFYTSIPNTVFGQEEEASVAEQVKEKYGELLQREDIQAVLPQVLEGLKDPAIQPLLNATTIDLVVTNPDLLTSFVPDIDPAFVELLKEDEELKAMLSDPLVHQLLTDSEAIDELAKSLAAGETTTDPELTPPEPADPELTDPEPTPPELTDPEVTPDPEVIEPPEPTTPPEQPPTERADPFEVLPDGESRLGGLSLNASSGAQFVDAIIGEAPLRLGREDLVEAIVGLVPNGFIDDRQIRQILEAKRLSAFVHESPQLDAENFGNAMTPNFSDFLYNDFGDAQNQKYLTSDSLHLYVRVPHKDGSVKFALSDGIVRQGTEVTMDEFQADTFQYTFQLEETLAAANLPAWPGSMTTPLFKSVDLRWHTDMNAPIYEREPMNAVTQLDGTTVWEFTEDIPADRVSTYYYFEVTLKEPVHFKTLDREAVAKMLEEKPDTISLEDILDTQHAITIEKWVMPDPRNLQLVDRGIIERLFTDDLWEAFIPIVANLLTSESPLTLQAVLNAATQQQMRRIQNILLRNTQSLTTYFEAEFDPLLASVFTVPKVDLEKHSLWVAHFDNIADGNYQVKAEVLDADGNVSERIQENVQVDTTPPEADIQISPGTTHTTGYQNSDVYIATAPVANSAATLNIVPDLQSGTIGPGEGYLFYQMIALDENGIPNPDITPNTWEPLTIGNTMLASDIWNAVIGNATDKQIASALKPFAAQLGLDTTQLTDAQIAGVVRAQMLSDILSNYLKVELIQGPVNMFLSSLGLENLTLNNAQTQLVIDLIGGTVDIINELVPVTFESGKSVVMPIQGEEMSLLVGNYGIRAMGIDSRFNVGGHVPPTHLRVVAPNDPAQLNRASVVLANIGDRNGDGLDERYEHGTIYANTTEGVELTIKIDEHPHFLAGIMAEYQDANGNWQPIGMLSEAELDGAQAGAEFKVMWDVPDAVFDTVDSDGFGSVMVRAVATNKLTLTDDAPMEFAIKLDAGIYPPEVLDLEVSFTDTNPDSGAPQGMVTVNATTLPQTGPRTAEVRFVATQGDGEPIELGTVTRDDSLVDAVQSAVDAAVDGADAPINTDNTVWSLKLDTTTLADTITKDSGQAARDVSFDNNQYTISAFAVTADGKNDWASDATAMLSVDNVDDVEPHGPTRITAIANTGGMVEADTHRGLVDENDPSVVPQSITLTIKPEAVRKTYKSVMLISDNPEINQHIQPVEETAEGSGIFTITVNIGALGIAGNGAYTLHAVAYDGSPDGPDPEFGNIQVHSDETTERTVHVKNYLRPDPAVFKLTVDADTETKNADSGGPQGTFTFTGYTIAQNSPPITSIRLEAKRASDTEGTTIGATDASTSVNIEDANLDDVLTHLVGIADEGTTVGNRSVVDIDTTYDAWVVSVDTIALELLDTITKDSTGARAIDTHGAWDESLDDDPYIVRAFAVDGSGTEWASGATVMFSLDNVDDVAPLAPTDVSVTSIAAIDSVLEDAGDGSFTVGGLVDKYDDAVPSPVATFTIEPTARRETYESIKFYPGVEGLVITDVTETPVGSGVFTLTVDMGILADMETYLANGTYMFHALAFDEFDNLQADDGTRTSVTVSNSRRPVPQVLAFTVGDPTQTNPDSGAPEGTIALYGYTPEITSAPTESVMFEVKRKNDTDWTPFDPASDPEGVTAADDAKLAAADIADVADVIGGNVVKSDTYQRWMIEIDTTTLEDSIDKDNPGARNHTDDNNMYMVRATASATADGSENLSADDVTAMFSVDNIDDVAPEEPTRIIVSSVDGVDTVLETAEDGSFTVGGLVDKYDDAVASPVATFTIKPTARRETYKSVKLTMYPEGALVGEITETEEGSGVFTVTVDVGTLADGTTYLENGNYTFQALAYDGVMDVVDDEFGNVETPTDGSKISVMVENTYRPAPEVLAIAVDPDSITQTNPDSGAPQGTITLNTRSYDITSPPIIGMRFEVKRPSDEEWTDVGTPTESMLVSDVSDAELTDVIGDLAVATAEATAANESGEPTVVAINQTYQEWMLQVDTTTLEDTITADSPAARDASKDDNQYMVRVTAIAAADQSETMSVDGITAYFSVDNVDDVEPHGPTYIVAVADVAGMITANADDNSYTVGGIVDDTVPSPIATFTIKQGDEVDPITYEGGSVNLVQTTADGTQTTTEGEAGVLDTITIDVGMLDNGTYMFHALTVDKFGNVQTEDSPMITVHVLNFRVSDVTDLAVIAVDGTDVPEPPAEPIPLRESVTVSFMNANDTLEAHELTGAVNGQMMPNDPNEDPENTFTLMVEVGALADGVYTPDGVVTKRNGSVAFPLTTVNVDNTGPIVMIESPTDGEAVDNLPTFHASYHDGAGAGVDGETGSLALARLQPPDAADVEVDQEALTKDDGALVYTRTERLAGGAYRVTVEVIDILGNVGSGSQEFVVNGTLPTVAIHSPASGQTFDHGQPLISGEFSGAGTVEVTKLTVNDLIVELDELELVENRFSYTPETALPDGNYTVAVEVTDADSNPAQTSVTFTVEIPKDTTPPVISAVAPTGIIKLVTEADKPQLGRVVISAVVTDEQSKVSSVKYRINAPDENADYLPVAGINIVGGVIQAPVNLAPGLYRIELVATSEGGSTKISWTFTVVFDKTPPAITSITPSGVVRGGLPVISASANDDSGVAEIVIMVKDSSGEEVNGETQGDPEESATGITRLDFHPEDPLEEGVYTIEVRATDTFSNSATAKGTFTVDFDTAAPVITVSSPRQDTQILLKSGDKAPTISITYADAESGINVESIRFILNDQLLTLSDKQKSASQVVYQLPISAASIADVHDYSWVGEYSVQLEVSDNAHLESDGNEANTTVHKFSFSMGKAEVPLLSVHPINVPNPFVDSTEIRFTLTRQSRVNIVIYDSTLRPVRVLIDGVAEPGKKEIEWDGTSSGGEDLARGIYFCQIMVGDDIEPEYAIIKLALTR